MVPLKCSPSQRLVPFPALNPSLPHAPQSSHCCDLATLPAAYLWSLFFSPSSVSARTLVQATTIPTSYVIYPQKGLPLSNQLHLVAKPNPGYVAGLLKTPQGLPALQGYRVSKSLPRLTKALPGRDHLPSTLLFGPLTRPSTQASFQASHLPLHVWFSLNEGHSSVLQLILCNAHLLGIGLTFP